MSKQIELLKQIEQEQDERKLLSLAFTNEGNIKSHQITAEEYSKNAVALSRKLGFGITSENLNKAAAKYKDIING